MLDIMKFPDLYDFEDKEKSRVFYINYMLDRTQSMFKYTNLPDTIPQKFLELYLQLNGHLIFTKVNNEYYVFYGSMGGKPDVYYMPTEYIYASPALDKSKNLKVGTECIIIGNDSMYTGLLPLFSKYASLLVENDISMRMVDINSRIVALLSSTDDRTHDSALKYLKDVENGKMGVIADNGFIEGIKTQPYAQTGTNKGIVELIEYQQYLKAGWFNDLGLQANYNMKREAINSNEAQLNEDCLFPLIDDMLKCRQDGIKKVNELYGLNISVDLDSVWKENQEERQTEQNVDNEQSKSDEAEEDNTNQSENIEKSDE